VPLKQGAALQHKDARCAALAARTWRAVQRGVPHARASGARVRRRR